MSFLHKLGIGVGSTEGAREVSGPVHLTSRARTPGGSVPPAAGAASAPVQEESNRLSNGLKELLWNLDGLERGALLDLGPAWQTTLSFFIERGFRVSSKKFLQPGKPFLPKKRKRCEETLLPAKTFTRLPAARATRFLKGNLQ